MRYFLGLLIALAVVSSTSCRDKEEPLTLAEATQALEESALSSQATTLVSGTIEISTNFQIGDAVEAAAQNLHDFIESQLPCAEITLQGNTLEVEYGVNDGNCTYKGQTYSGVHTITVTRNEDNSVEVAHEWDELANQTLSVSGVATVTWSWNEQLTRHVVHSLEWTRLSDGRTGTGSGDRIQKTLEGGLVEGIQIDGSRTWVGEAGTWDLAINGIEVRWVDPVPQSGTWSLATPFDKTLSVTFERIDESTIKVTLKGTSKEFSFNVKSTGEFE